MSGHYDDYYSSASRYVRDTSTNRPGRDRDRELVQELPPLRDVLPDQFEVTGDRHHPYNFPHRRDGIPAGTRLPPIQDSFPYHRHGDDHGHNRPAAYPHHSGQTPSGLPSAHYSGSDTRDRNPTYHVLVPSHERDLLPAPKYYAKPPGNVRDNVLSSGIYDNDPKKKFECNICGRRIDRQSVYNQHMLTHTGERPFECPHCPKAFNSKSNLNRHLLSHGRQGNGEDDGRERHGEASSSKKYYSSSRRT